MMAQLSDQELLDRFRQRQDPDALNELVRRYIGLVHTAAMRQVRDTHLAADITQAVFIVLVRKANSIRRDAVLPAWLYTVTRHAVANARRVRARRRAYETRRAMMTTEQVSPPADTCAEQADEIRRVLDRGMARLPHLERCTVLMHFFGGKSHEEVGKALGMSEEAARKRLSRGLEKLRGFMCAGAGGAATRTLALPPSALAATLAAEGAASAACGARTDLVVQTAVAALAARRATASSVAEMIACATARTLRAAKLRLATMGLLVALLLALTATSLVALARRTHPSRAASAPAAAQADPVYAITFGARANVRILGVSPYPPDANSWFAADGQPIALPDPRLLEVTANTAVPPQFILGVRVENPGTDLLRLAVGRSLAGASVMIPDGDNAVIVACLVCFYDPAPDRAQVTLTFGERDWKTVGTSNDPTSTTRLDVPGLGSMTIEPPEPDAGGGSHVVMRHRMVAAPYQLVAIDHDSRAHPPVNMNVMTLPPNVTTTSTFDLPREQISRFELQAKSFTRFVDASDVSLRKDHLTRPTIAVRQRARP